MKILFVLLTVSAFILLVGCQSQALPTEEQKILISTPGEQLVPTSKPVESTQTTAARQIIPPPTNPPEPDAVADVGTAPVQIVTPDADTQNLIRLAKENLAGKLNIDGDQIQLLEIGAVMWPDSSLGCPQMGNMYTQVVTPGFQIKLEAAGKAYVYHTDNKDRILLCQLKPGLENFSSP